MANIQKDTIKVIADTVGVKFKEEVAHGTVTHIHCNILALAADVEYRLREIVQVRITTAAS